MAASKLTRVRSEGFSNTRPSVRPEQRRGAVGRGGRRA